MVGLLSPSGCDITVAIHSAKENARPQENLRLFII